MGHKTKLLFCVLTGVGSLLIAGLVVGILVDWTKTEPDVIPDTVVNALDYFNTTDPLAIRWYHGTNSQDQLQEGLQGRHDMLEGDVQLRWAGYPNQTTEPIMAHPPDVDSDLTAGQYIEAITARTDKGMKLDFKSLEAVKPSLQILKDKGKIKNPVWANADVVKGPGSDNVPVDPKQFIELVDAIFPAVTLSLGWTTGCCAEPYTRSHMEEMWQVCRDTVQPVSLPARAALLWRSWVDFRWLIMQDPAKFTVTVWTPSGADDWEGVGPYDMLKVRNDIQKRHIYYDLPGERYEQFKRIAITAGNPLNHFSGLEWDAINVKWSRHTNGQDQLSAALTDTSIHMVQGDVVANSTWKNPIMGLPGANNTSTSLQLDSWIGQCSTTRKGILILFGEDSVIEESIKVVNSFNATYQQPVWLGGDIFKGPNSKGDPPLNATLLEESVQAAHPAVSLVLGWLTGHPSGNATQDVYTLAMIKEMLTYASVLEQPVVFRVRLLFARESWNVLEKLLEESRAYTMLIYAEDIDSVDPADIDYVRQTSEHGRIFFDIPYDS